MYPIQAKNNSVISFLISHKFTCFCLQHRKELLAKLMKSISNSNIFQKEFIDQIEPLNIEARYPSHKERLLKSLTDDKSLDIIQSTKEIQKWKKGKL